MEKKHIVDLRILLQVICTLQFPRGYFFIYKNAKIPGDSCLTLRHPSSVLFWCHYVMLFSWHSCHRLLISITAQLSSLLTPYYFPKWALVLCIPEWKERRNNSSNVSNWTFVFSWARKFLCEQEKYELETFIPSQPFSSLKMFVQSCLTVLSNCTSYKEMLYQQRSCLIFQLKSCLSSCCLW